MSYKRYKKTPVMRGNSKLGTLPNVSLLPIETCPLNKYCRDACYAVKFTKVYPSVKKAWSDNTNLARNDMEAFFDGIREALDGLKPEFFRLHVSGDFFSQEYFNAWCQLASEYPDTKFLAFTKALGFVRGSIPDNLEIVLSVFPGMRIPSRLDGFPIAAAGQVGDYTESKHVERIGDAMTCPGLCETCGMCWNLSKIGKDVRFSIH